MGILAHSWLQVGLWGMTGCALLEEGWSVEGLAGEVSREDIWGRLWSKGVHEGVKGREWDQGQSLGTRSVGNGREGGQQHQLLLRVKGGVCQVSPGTLAVAASF